MTTRNPIDVLRMALEREKDAVQYYKEYATTATEPVIREMFEFLVAEEVKHVKLLEAEVEKEVYQEN
jgi:rubrerythrin